MGGNGLRTLVLGIFLLLLALPAWGFSEQDIVSAVRDEARLKYQSQDVEVEWKAPALETLLGSKPPEGLKVRLSRNTRLMGEIPVPIPLYKGDRIYRTIFPRMNIRAYGQVLVTKTRIGKGEELGEDNIEIQRKPLKDLPNAPLTDKQAAMLAKARRDIPPGTVLTSGLINLPSVIKSGSMVKVQVVCGDLTVLGNGLALSDGQIGQLVKLRNPDSKREFSGRVVSENLVEVRLED